MKLIICRVSYLWIIFSNRKPNCTKLWGVTGQDPELAVVRGRHDRIGLALEGDPLGGDDADLKRHYSSSRLAASAASSIVPTI